MHKTLLLFLFISLFFSSVLCARHKAFAQFYPPPNIHQPAQSTGKPWRCSYVGLNEGPPTNCDSPGVYLVFSINDAEVEVNGQERQFQFPLTYIGRSVDNARGRIVSNRNDFKYTARDIVCFMEFDVDDGFRDTNNVTPIEQQLLQAFVTQSNSWDNQGFQPGRDTLFVDENGIGYDPLRTFYEMDIHSEIADFHLVEGRNWNNNLNAHLIFNINHKVKEEDVDVDDIIFPEGIPYDGGLAHCGHYCSKNDSDFKPYTPGYLDRVRAAAAIINDQSIKKKNGENNHHHAEIAAGAAGYAAYQAIQEANIAKQIGNWARSISREAWEKGYSYWKEGAKKGGNYARQGAREGYEAWKEGAEKGGNYARQGAREGFEAWKEGAKKGGDIARQGAQRIGESLVENARQGTNVVFTNIQQI